MSPEGSYSSPIQNEVKSYLSKLGESAGVVIHQDVLSIVPNSLRERFKTRMQLHEVWCPSVTLNVENIENLKKKLKEEIKSQKKEPVIEGIFGDDDYYVSNQLFKNIPSTSKTSLKRKSCTVTEDTSYRRKLPRVDYRSSYQEDETSQEIFNDEALDTSGESTSDCPPNISVNRVSSRKNSKNPYVVSKSVMFIYLVC